MALPELQQAHTLIEKAHSIALLVPEKSSADAFSSMVALYLALQNSKKGTIDEISPSHVPKNLQFLPGSSQVKMQPQKKPDVILDIAGPQEISNIRPEKVNGGIRLHITFDEGTSIKKEQLETLVRPLPYDIAIILGASDLEDLGSIFTSHADFFYNTPIINIDHRADNEHFGTVNMVDITASSVAEVTYELIMHLTKKIDPTIATALYAGIIAGTDSFQKPSTTPTSFKVAAQLMEAKADREVVIQNLVKTKPLHLLKLVGRIYARLRYDENIRLFWSIVRPIDFQESNSTVADLPDAMKELANNIADFNAAYLVYENQQGYELYLLLGKGLKKRREDIQTKLAATRDNGTLKVPLQAANLTEAEDKALEKIRTILP